MSRKQQKIQTQKRREFNEDLELTLLSRLARFGWLTSTQLAFALGIDLRLTRCMLHDLLGDRMIDKAYIPVKLPAYYLTQKGVRRLQQHFPKTTVVSGKDLRFGHSAHRLTANSVLLGVIANINSHSSSLENNDIHFWSEYEIQRRLSPIRIRSGTPDRTSFKIPDGLFKTSETSFGWIEVENSPRNPNQRQALVEFIQQGLLMPDAGLARYGITISHLILASSKPAILRSSIDLARRTVLQFERPEWLSVAPDLSETDYRRTLLKRIAWWLQGTSTEDGIQWLNGSMKNLFEDPYMSDFHWPDEAVELNLIQSTTD